DRSLGCRAQPGHRRPAPEARVERPGAAGLRRMAADPGGERIRRASKLRRRRRVGSAGRALAGALGRHGWAERADVAGAQRGAGLRLRPALRTARPGPHAVAALQPGLLRRPAADALSRSGAEALWE